MSERALPGPIVVGSVAFDRRGGTGDGPIPLCFSSTVINPICMAGHTRPAGRRLPGDRHRKARRFIRSLADGALAGIAETDTLVLSPESAREVLTPARLELLDRLQEGPVDSVRGLAAELGRDKAGVSRDLTRLAELDLIEAERVGRSKRPRLKYDTVLIEPLV